MYCSVEYLLTAWFGKLLLTIAAVGRWRTVMVVLSKYNLKKTPVLVQFLEIVFAGAKVLQVPVLSGKMPLEKYNTLFEVFC